MSYGERNFAETTADNTIDQVSEPIIVQPSSTSLSVQVETLGMTGKNNITTYKVVYQKMNYAAGGFIGEGSPLTVTSGTNPVTLSGLVANGLYKVTTQAISASGAGNTITVYYKLSSTVVSPSKDVSNSSVAQTGSNTQFNPLPAQKVTVKSFLKIDAPKENNKISYAYKDFSSVQLGTYTTNSVGSGAFQRNTRSYSEGYYSFGTSILFDPLIKYTPQSAGLGFFLDSSNSSGYFIVVKTTSTAAALNTTPVEIFKLKSKQMIRLSDSQKGNRATLDQLFAGTVYNLDVKVKINGQAVTITAYVNGFKVEATDQTTGVDAKEILYPSTRVALVGLKGTSKFDYVYADTIKQEDYLKDYKSLNLYYGQFSKDFLDTSYGDLLYNSLNEDVDQNQKPTSFEEFGTVVRELRKRSVRFSSPPAIPIRWTTGGNNLATILSETKDNFKSDVMVLNNSSITIPLSDRGVNQLSIFGTTIGFSGELEYSTSPVAQYSTAEPVIFQSTWLQNQKDVKSLAEWIRGRVVNKAKIITMEVFGNPLISVGDIITVNYPYQGLTTSQKIIVVKVSQSFGGGLKTSIVGRTL